MPYCIVLLMLLFLNIDLVLNIDNDLQLLLKTRYKTRNVKFILFINL